jgi:hypothetical protein
MILKKKKKNKNNKISNMGVLVDIEKGAAESESIVGKLAEGAGELSEETLATFKEGENVVGIIQGGEEAMKGLKNIIIDDMKNSIKEGASEFAKALPGKIFKLGKIACIGGLAYGLFYLVTNKHEFVGKINDIELIGDDKKKVQISFEPDDPASDVKTITIYPKNKVTIEGCTISSFNNTFVMAAEQPNGGNTFYLQFDNAIQGTINGKLAGGKVTFETSLLDEITNSVNHISDAGFNVIDNVINDAGDAAGDAAGAVGKGIGAFFKGLFGKLNGILKYILIGFGAVIFLFFCFKLYKYFY